MAVLAPAPALAATEADAWTSARTQHAASAAAVKRAATTFTERGQPSDLRALREVVAGAIHSMDEMEVHDCFRVWWSYARTSFVMYDLALMNVQKDDLARANSATAAGMYLAVMAQATTVDCPRTSNRFSTDGPRQGGGDLPLVNAPS